METFAFWAVIFFAALVLYRVAALRAATPKARVTAMLRRCRAFEAAGLSTHQSLLRLLSTRRHWKKLPHIFLAELVARLEVKEDVLRFITFSEDRGYYRELYPRLAAAEEINAAMSKVACSFTRFAMPLQQQGRYKEAEFVQRLALRLEPNRYFTTLPLAATYHATGRHTDALRLFELGVAQLKALERNHERAEKDLSPANCLASEADFRTLRHEYNKLYEACLKAAAAEPPPQQR